MPSRLSFRLIPALDTYPRVVALAQTVPGKAVVLAVYAFGLSLHTGNWLQLSLMLAALTFLPRFRAPLLVCATFIALYLGGWLNFDILAEHAGGALIGRAWFKPSVVLVVLLAFAAYYRLVKERKDGWLGKRPIRNLILFYLGLICLASALPLPATLWVAVWAVVIVLGKYLWYFAYALLGRQAKETPHLGLQTGHFLPFWGGSNAPFPKGAAYLRRIEAKTPEQLAVCQLKGIKLLAWTLVLTLFVRLLGQLFYGHPEQGNSFMGITLSLGIPSFNAVLHSGAGQAPYPWHMNWMALLAAFCIKVVAFSIWGHGIIATCRMAGYNALRNTYKPLHATTIADFWNRYYYYFKELLVENFFYPAFLRYFKKSPRLRLFFATLAAAGFGNVLFHYLRDIDVIITMGPWQALVSFHVYLFYGLVLGTAIGISQLFEKKRPAEELPWLQRRVVKPMMVIAFYCLLSIFDDPDRSLVLTDYFSFLLRLFNIHPE